MVFKMCIRRFLTLPTYLPNVHNTSLSPFEKGGYFAQEYQKMEKRNMCFWRWIESSDDLLKVRVLHQPGSLLNQIQN
jgi:hypothetical protein